MVKNWHPYTDFRSHKLSDWERVLICREYLQEEAAYGNCRCLNRDKPLTCSCLESLLDNEIAQEAIAAFMLSFYKKKRDEQYQIIIDWLKYTRGQQKRMFYVPFLNPKDENAVDGDDEILDAQAIERDRILSVLSNTRVCRVAIGRILNWGRKKWDKSIKCLEKNISPAHGLKGKRPNNVWTFDQSFMKEDITEFFEDLKELTQPQSTRIMRVETGVGLRDGEADTYELPPTFTKRSLYYKFCKERGWRVTLKINSNSTLEYTEIDNFEGKRSNICSWRYFQLFWQSNYPNIKIVSRTADVCTKCHVFRNRLKYVRFDNTIEPGTNYCMTERSIRKFFISKENQRTEGVEVLTAQQETREVITTPEDDIYAPMHMEPEAACSENNSILEEAAIHVKQAADQRRLCNRKMKEAHHDFINGVGHSERRYCLVIDYCQNAQLPNLGRTQPGETYYMTPLTIPILGMVDCSLKGGSLDAFVYHEGIGSKGGDNVASMIIMLLKKKGWMKEDVVGGELSILMDNCGGQNKNNHVLRIANMLVEAGYFKKVNFVFYVVGHTKNCADRWFNTMKRDYRCQNIYTFDMLCDALATNERIRVHPVVDGDFKQFRKFEDMFYFKLESGSVQPGHIFSVDSSSPTVITILRDRLGTAPACVQDIQKQKQKISFEERRKIMREALRDFVLLDPINPTGIKPIKQIELYTKWRKLVPAEFADIICPYPGDEAMRKHKEERNRKARERTQRKRDSQPTRKKKKTE